MCYIFCKPTCLASQWSCYQLSILRLCVSSHRLSVHWLYPVTHSKKTHTGYLLLVIILGECLCVCVWLLVMVLLDDRRRRKSLSMAICQIKASACCRRAREVSGDRLCGRKWEGGEWLVDSYTHCSLSLYFSYSLFISVIFLWQHIQSLSCFC